ncbi:MAG: gliding motility-associated ABC transporter ATP-binding subunit GldA [Tenacibaculum sp.]
MSIQLTSVTKIYGNKKAVDSVSFSAQKGQILGFIGPNGAGKTSTLKIICGYLKPTQGEILVCNTNVVANPIKAQRHIGYLPEQNPLYTQMYVREYLQFIASVHKISKREIEPLIEKLGLAAEANKKIKQLSKGYKQRVGLAVAILHNPQVLVLDEPTTGLDPNQLLDIRKLIKDLGKDKTVLLSTHIMQEIEALCDRVLIINKGKLIADKFLDELKTSNKQVISVTFDYKVEEQFIDKLPNISSFKNTSENNWTLVFESKKDMRSAVFDFAQQSGLKILGLRSENKNLEKLFQDLTN